MIKRSLAGLLLCVAWCCPGFGAEPGFSFLEAGYARQHGRDWMLFKGSIALGDHAAAGAAYEKFDTDYGSVSLTSLGADVRWWLNDSWQLVTGLSADFVLSDGHPEFDEEDLVALGYAGAVGLRGAVNERLELQAGLEYQYLTRDVAASVGLRYYVTRHFAVGVDVDDSYFDKRVGFMLRYSFDSR